MCIRDSSSARSSVSGEHIPANQVEVVAIPPQIQEMLEYTDEFNPRQLLFLRKHAVELNAFIDNGTYETDRDDIDGGEFLVEDVLLEHGITFVNGDTGIGKTFFLAAIIHCLSTGDPFLNKPTQQRPCYVIELEGKGNYNLRDLAICKY